MMEATAKAIFITNTFAGAHPEEHVALWNQFEKDVPFSKRSGAYGADNIAYIRWLKTQQSPVVVNFLKELVIQHSL